MDDSDLTGQVQLSKDIYITNQYLPFELHCSRYSANCCSAAETLMNCQLT